MSGSDDSGKKKLEVIYSNLLKLYELTNERRRSLTTQATSLLSFTGIIQTVFLGLLITLATSSQARDSLLAVPNNALIINLLSTGFVTFMITIALAFIAYIEWKWVPAPEVLFGTNPIKWNETLKNFEAHPDTIPIRVFEIQLMHGITDNNRINNYKYWTLITAYISFATSLFLLATVGFYIITTLA